MAVGRWCAVSVVQWAMLRTNAARRTAASADVMVTATPHVTAHAASAARSTTDLRGATARRGAVSAADCGATGLEIVRRLSAATAAIMDTLPRSAWHVHSARSTVTQRQSAR